MDELKEAEIDGQLFLQDAAMWTQPGAQQRSEPLVIAGILARAREAGGVAEATQALDTAYRISKNDRFLR